MHLEEDPRTSQVWRKKEVNWPYVNKVRVGLQRKLSAKELMLLNCDIGEDS